MSLSAKTIISLACILSNKGDLDTKPLEAQLTSEDQVRVAEAIDSGACLPADVDALIAKTRNRIELGEIADPQGSTSPTREC